MSAAARRRLVARARLARDHGVAPRRSARLAGSPPAATVSLAELAHWPGWPAGASDAQAAAFKLIALVAARDALGRVIEGHMLRAFAAEVGEGVLEAVLALPPGGDRPLPPPAQLRAQGEALARGALPGALRPAGAQTADPQAARFVAIAEAVGEAET
ncbi:MULTISPECIES: hypothetical protein [unclassified Sphingomonas]|uniref:hypothetical protein n=1 Tax=unclassified Sphingomonas TaxID=196159 RepID=UPI00083390CA|nr:MULTISPECIES: hypothetical protein [unclassified Sphingomonas]